MTMRRTFGVALGALLIGCGGGDTKPAASPAAPSPSASASAALAPPAPRSPSPALRRVWALGPDADTTAYVDVRGMQGTELVRGVLPELLGMADGNLPPPAAACVRSLLGVARELLVGRSDARGPMIALAVDPLPGGKLPEACAALGTAMPATNAPGVTAAYGLAEGVLVVLPETLVWSPNPELLNEAVAGKGSSATTLSLQPNQYLAFQSNLRQEQVTAAGGVTMTNDLFSVAADLTFASEAQAQAAERTIAEGREKAASMAKLPTHSGERLLGSFHVQRNGSTLRVSLELREAPREQAYDLGVIAALATYGVRRYVQTAKVAEARQQLFVIAEHLKTSLEPAKPGGARKKLTSLPPVPKEVPRGERYRATADEWQAWSKIGFSMPDGQFFQYEVKAAPNGKHADVYARGDLDGDGKQSELRLPIDVTPPATVTWPAEPVETDPLE